MNELPKPAKKWKPLLALALVFLAGILVGAGGTRIVIRRVIHRAAQDPDFIRVLLERDLNRKLGLDAAQKEKSRQITLEAQGRFRALRHDFQPRALEILTHFQSQIDTLLTPQQHEKFLEMRKNKVISNWVASITNEPAR